LRDKERYLLEPVNELFDESSEQLLRLAVVESASLVELGLLFEPLDDEFLVVDLLIVEELHKCGGELAHLRVLPREEEDHGLQELLPTTGSILADQLHEGLLMLDPVAHGVPLGAEEPAEEDPVAELGPECQSSLQALKLLGKHPV